MSVQITNNYSGSIGRMFARQNVSSVYSGQKVAGAAAAEETNGLVDKVSLSSFAPKPLSADFLEDAMNAGKTLGENGALAQDTTERLREDRVFAAVSALALIGHDGTQDLPLNWPGGIPSPTRDELEAARRRLAQRPQNIEDASNPEQVRQDRVELMQKIGKRDFSPPSAEAAVEVAAREN